MKQELSAWRSEYLKNILNIGVGRFIKLVLLLLLLTVVYKFAAGATKYAAVSIDSVEFGALLLILLCTVALAIWQRSARYLDFWRPLHILMRGAAIVIFAQVCVDALHPAAWISNVVIGVDAPQKLLIAIAFVCGALAMSRPSFVVPMGAAYIAFRYHAGTAFELGHTSLDFQTLNDITTFSSGTMLAWRIALQNRSRLPRAVAEAVVEPKSSLVFQKLVWALCVGVHVGNYFHSALAKIHVGGPHPAFWLLNNPTAQSVAIGLYRLNGPLAGWPTLVEGYYDLLTLAVLPLNFLVFFLQLFSPLSILSRRALIIFTLAFDLMHIAIYFSLGAFFFFWIALNILILLSLSAMTDKEFSPEVKITAVLGALFGFLFFYQAGLGWLDGRKVVREVFYAQLENGQRVLVPPATFGLYSYQISHGSLFIPANHFLMRSGGNATISDWRDASNCGPAVEQEQAIVPLNGVEKMIRTADAFYRRHPWVQAHALYYTYPHHAPSNPAYFKDYDRIAVADIRAYIYVVESACIVVRNGRLDNDVRVRSEFRFGV